jgi:hypothetical protein
MSAEFNRPLLGPMGRSRLYQEYFSRQPSARQQEILTGERTYQEDQGADHTWRDHALRQYAEDLTVSIPTEHGQQIENLLDVLG